MAVVNLYNSGMKMKHIAKKQCMDYLEAYAMTKHAHKYGLTLKKRVNRINKDAPIISHTNNLIRDVLIKELDTVINCERTRALFNVLKVYI